MKKRVWIVGLIVLMAAMLMTGCGPKGNSAAVTDSTTPAAVAVQEEKPVTVGFIYVGPIGDGGYTYAHDQGRLYLEEKFGTKVKTIIK